LLWVKIPTAWHLEILPLGNRTWQYLALESSLSAEDFPNFPVIHAEIWIYQVRDSDGTAEPYPNLPWPPCLAWLANAGRFVACFKGRLSRGWISWWASFKGNLECSCVSLESEDNSDLVIFCLLTATVVLMRPATMFCTDSHLGHLLLGPSGVPLHAPWQSYEVMMIPGNPPGFRCGSSDLRVKIGRDAAWSSAQDELRHC
jgi:hypothetical protein